MEVLDDQNKLHFLAFLCTTERDLIFFRINNGDKMILPIFQ